MPRIRTAHINRSALRDFRLLHGWSIAELARRAGASSQHVANVERGARPCSAELAARLATALGVARESLLMAPLTVPGPSRADRPTQRQGAAA